MNRFAEVIETLRHGKKIPFDKEQIERCEPFAGVYAWWASADPPRPVKPMIRPIRAGECMRVGSAEVLPGKNPDRRLWKGMRNMPGVLTYSERDR